MLRTASRRWNSDSHSQGNLQPSSPGPSRPRSGSMRLHGFQQKRALRHGGLKTVETNYLNCAADGDVQVVKMMFKKYNNEQLNRNCTDYFDRTALTLAITNHRDGMIQYLLEAGVDMTESFFYAIENEYTEAVEYILSSETAQRTGHGEMLITSEESIFSRFLSPIMLAAHKNNYEILEILYNHGHRLRNHSVNASNKWDEMRLKWLYYKARASQAYMILMYNKEQIDTLNEAIELYGTLTMEGITTREVRENYKELASQCEDFAIALLDQLRTAQELADILRFTLVGREHGNTNTNQLVLSTIPVLLPPSPSEDVIDGQSSLGDKTVLEDSQILEDSDMAPRQFPAIQVTNTNEGGTLGRRTELANAPRNLEAERHHDTAQWIRNVTNAQVAVTPHMDSVRRKTTQNDSARTGPTTSTDLDQSRPSQAIDNVRQERRRTMGKRGHIVDSGNHEYARPIHFLKPIEKAVNYGMVRLVTCQNSQLALTYLKDGILFRDSSPATGLAKKCLVALMFPIISIAFYFFPNSRVGLVARNPTAKLWMEVASDICLIVLLVMNLLLSEYNVFSPNGFSPVLIIAYFWMPGKFINLMFLAYHQGKRVLYSIWNWNDITTILLYTGFMILRIYGLTLKEEARTKSQWAPIPLADMMISMVYILVFLRPLEILRVNRTFGPLQVSVDRMLKDVAKFFLLFLVIWFAFSSGINTLFWRYRGPCSARVDNNNLTDKYCCFEDNTKKFTDLGTSLQVHFWSIFGYSDEYSEWFDLSCLEDAKKVVTARFGEGIFALYHIGTVLVLVNMLIAIMSGTLQKTIDDSDIQWQFHRTRVWIRFIRTGFYRPPPMNILPRPKEIYFVFKALAKGCRAMCRCVKRDNQDHSDHASETRIHLQSFRKGGKLKLEGPLQARFGQSLDDLSGDSANVAAVEERGSRYDVTLRKCVKRYLKTNVVQGDEQFATTTCRKDEE